MLKRELLGGGRTCQIVGAAVALALTVFVVYDRQSMGSADDRACIIQQAVVVEQEWTALIFGHS